VRRGWSTTRQRSVGTSSSQKTPSLASRGDVRGVGVFWAVELVKDRATKEPLAPYGGSSPAMNEVIGACKKGGLLPFSNYNRIHMVPPCNTSADEVREALSVLDAALSVGDAHAEG
jgi:taurine--2-oxoglutarate transaminase